MRSNSLKQFAALLVVFITAPLFAHHGVNAPLPVGNGGMYSGSAYGLFSNYRKAEPENRNAIGLYAFLNLSLFEDRMALFVSIPWVYYQQKDRRDAARYGRIGTGLRGTIFRNDSVSFDVRLSGLFPAEGSAGSAVRENWSEIRPAAILTKFQEGLYFQTELEGVFPTSSLPQPQIPDYLFDSGLLPGPRVSSWKGYTCFRTPICSPPPEEPTTSTHELKKAMRMYSRIGWNTGSTIAYAGFLYRTPYGESLVLKEVKSEIDLVFREVGLGFSHRFGGITISAGWSRPLRNRRSQTAEETYYYAVLVRQPPPDRDRFVPYRESWEIAVAVAF